MHLIIIQLQRQAFWFLVDFQVSKILAQSIFSVRRPHNDTRINASNVSSFNWLLRSFFTQICWENPRSLIVVLAKVKLQSMLSQNCRSYWNLEVSARVPRLESRCVSICKLQPLYFVTSNFWRGLHCDGWKLCRTHFCEVHKTITQKKLFWRPKWHLTSVEDINIEHCSGGLTSSDKFNDRQAEDY